MSLGEGVVLAGEDGRHSHFGAGGETLCDHAPLLLDLFSQVVRETVPPLAVFEGGLLFGGQGLFVLVPQEGQLFGTCRVLVPAGDALLTSLHYGLQVALFLLLDLPLVEAELAAAGLPEETLAGLVNGDYAVVLFSFLALLEYISLNLGVEDTFGQGAPGDVLFEVVSRAYFAKTVPSVLSSLELEGLYFLVFAGVLGGMTLYDPLSLVVVVTWARVLLFAAV